METLELAHCRAAITAAFPELATSRFELATEGWDSVAVDVDDRLIFKFPRHAVAEKALQREAQLLAVIRPQISMPVPDLRIAQGLPLFSVHEKLKGVHLVTADYDRLPEVARQRLGERLGRFYAELHYEYRKILRAGARFHPVGPDLCAGAGSPAVRKILAEHVLKVLLDDDQGMAASLIERAGGDAKAPSLPMMQRLPSCRKFRRQWPDLSCRSRLPRFFDGRRGCQEGRRQFCHRRTAAAGAGDRIGATSAIAEEGRRHGAWLNQVINEIRKGRTADGANAEQGFDALKKYARDLTAEARDGKLDPGDRPRRRNPPHHPGAVAPHQEQSGADR
jgi:hypothetical protein